MKRLKKVKGKCCSLLWKIVLFGVIFAAISQIIHNICAFLGMNYYTDPKYFALWSKIMMPAQAAPGFGFYLYALFFAFVSGMLFALVFTVVKKGVPFKGIKKGIAYALLVFLIATVPNSLATILTLAIPYCLVALWVIEALVIYLLTGIVLAKMFR